MSQNGYDPEDVLQEVYKGLLVRNAGKCPWDPAKSSFGHYVHMVCGCILSNYHRKQYRIREVEQLGISSPIEEGGWADVASNTTVPALPTSMQVDALLREEVASLTNYLKAGSSIEGRLAAQILPLIVQGMSRQDMAPALGVSRTAITRAYAHLRTQTLDWKDSLKEQSGTSRTANPSFLSLDAIIAD
jgi:hypothetical protein